MIKKIFSISLLVAISTAALYSCRKSDQSTGDATLNYFPLKFGKYVTYDVDSINYYGPSCTEVKVSMQMKYVITDTFLDSRKRLTYLLDVYSRPYEGAIWHQSNVIFVTPTPAGLLYTQDGTQYVKMTFPVKEGTTWKGNQYATTDDSLFSYLKGWNYKYTDYNRSYYTGGYRGVNFDNTVSLLLNDESVNYPTYDSGVHAYRTFAKEVYAYNVGMIYKEWTHWTYKPGRADCKSGYSVIMRAIDHN
jgi:hypothetical protein